MQQKQHFEGHGSKFMKKAKLPRKNNRMNNVEVRNRQWKK